MQQSKKHFSWYKKKSFTEIPHLYNKIVPYNIFSIEKIKEIAAAYNFELSYQKEFIIDCDLPDIHEGRGSYTVKKENLERMMFTDVLHLPWYFLYFSKKV